MKRTSWEWENSNKKVATKIMWDTQGQEYDHVCGLISQACDLDNTAARALYRKICRDGLVEQGFVPAAPKLGRPRKDGSAPVSRAQFNPANTECVYDHAPVVVVPEPEPERTETGERKSIADMKAYLAELKKKAGAN